MKKIVLYISFIAIITGCKKNELTTAQSRPPSRTDLIYLKSIGKAYTLKDYLCNKWWIVTDIAINPAIERNGLLYSNLTNQYKACELDDLTFFSEDNTLITDAQSVCDVEPVSAVGAWDFNKDSTKLLLVATKSRSTLINILDSTQMVLSTSVKYGTQSYTVTTTYVPVK